jgi:hypothetical protein
MGEAFIRIQGVQHYLWRAVDQDGVVLDILVQERRDAKAAKRLFRRLLMATFVRVGTGWQPASTARPGPRHSIFGSRRGRSWAKRRHHFGLD